MVNVNTESEGFALEDHGMFMTTQDSELFEAHPLYKYVTQIATVVLQVRAQLHSNEVKLDLIKAELDSLRLGLQTFLDKVNDTPEESQSILDNSLIVSDEGTGQFSGAKPFVSVEVDGVTRSVVVGPSLEYKMKGTDVARTRCRLLLEHLHDIAELKLWTVTGKRIVKEDGKSVKKNGPSVPTLTMQYLYQMEADRRKLDVANAELMKALKLEVNNHVGRILESYRSGNGEETPGRKAGKRRLNDVEASEGSEDESSNSNRYLSSN